MRARSGVRRMVLGAMSVLWLSIPIAASAQSPAPVPTADPAATAPNVRVTDIRSTFVSSVPDTDGDGCSGPYLDLRFTIANLGTTYPVPDELVQTQTIPLPPDGYTLLVLNVWIDQFGTGESMAQAAVPVLMNDVPGSVLEPGQSVEVTWRYRVPDDQRSMRFFGEIAGAHFFRTWGSTGERYDTTVPIPIWDIRPRQVEMVPATAESGAPLAVARVTFENNGGSDTPGPVSANVNLKYPDVSTIGGYTAVSTGPIAAGGTVQVIGQTTLDGDRPLDRDRAESQATAQALCPDGSYGDLSDGKRADNGRTLRQLGKATPAPSGS